MNDDILKLAKECGIFIPSNSDVGQNMEAFYRAAFNDGLKKAASSVGALEVHEIGHPGTAFAVQEACINTIHSLEMKP